MQTFQFSEVLEFLKANPEKAFNYANGNLTDEACCLMAEFFKTKGFGSGTYVTFKGDELIYFRGDIAAKIEDFPLENIGDIHRDIKLGKDILERYENLVK